MSIETQVAIASWIAVSVVVFLVASLMLDDRSIPQKDKIWIGRIGLAAPLWPVLIVLVIIVFFLFMARDLVRAARGSR